MSDNNRRNTPDKFVYHLEIAIYENLIMLARKLDLPMDVRQKLDDNLEEEQQTKKQRKAMADNSAVRKSLQD